MEKHLTIWKDFQKLTESLINFMQGKEKDIYI